MAIWPPADVVDHLWRRVPAGLRLTPLERWHITLCFLSEADPGEVERALDGLPSHPPVTLRLAGSRQFGRKVLAAGVEGDLTVLHRSILEALGADRRPLIPHLTVTYHRPPDLQWEGYRGPEWTADEIRLVHSQDGYHRLRSWPLLRPSRAES